MSGDYLGSHRITTTRDCRSEIEDCEFSLRGHTSHPQSSIFALIHTEERRSDPERPLCVPGSNQMQPQQIPKKRPMQQSIPGRPMLANPAFSISELKPRHRPECPAHRRPLKE